jgi:hypothetical protein
MVVFLAKETADKRKYIDNKIKAVKLLLDKVNIHNI